MKLVVTEYISLDGGIENPLWIGPYFDADFLKFKFDELMSADALLMGRGTYDYFLPVWLHATGEDDAPGQEGFADRLTALPKHVVSNTLITSEWNNVRFVNSNIVDTIAELKQQPGQDLLVAGSGTLVQTLMQYDLVDEYRFLVYPLVVGSGQKLFPGGIPATLELVEARPFSTGVVVLTYRAKREV